MRAIFSLLAPGGARARLSILIFHRVLPLADELFPGEVDAERFDRICHWMGHWFNVMPLDHAAACLKTGTLPSRALAITFDDGYADNHDVALPILRKHGLTATFFVSTGFLDGGRMWNDSLIELVRHARGPILDLSGVPLLGLEALDIGTVQAKRQTVHRLLKAAKYLSPVQRADAVQQATQLGNAELPRNLMMRLDQVRKLHQSGMQVGAHTVTHPILTTLQDAAAEAEMRESRRCLEAATGAPVKLFAYPNGRPGEDFGPRDVTLARECGFQAAVTTAPGASNLMTDLFQLPRYTPWKQDRSRFAMQLAANLIEV